MPGPEPALSTHRFGWLTFAAVMLGRITVLGARTVRLQRPRDLPLARYGGETARRYAE
jgi:hypothetical protein